MRSVVIVVLPERGVAIEGGSPFLEGGGEVLVEGLSFTSGYQFFNGVDESDRKDLQAMLGEQLKVYIELNFFHGLIELGHLFDDVLIKTHEDRI